MRTEKNVSAEPSRSRPECAASESMPRLPVNRPAISLSAVMPQAASMDIRAAPRFRLRMACPGCVAIVGSSGRDMPTAYTRPHLPGQSERRWLAGGIQARDAKGVRRPADIAEACALKRCEHLRWRGETPDRRGQVRIGAARAREQAPDAREHAAKVKGVEL